MKFSNGTRIKASLNDTFAALADFEYFETLARHSGKEVKRTDTLSAPGPGMAWGAEVNFRGKTRDLCLKLVDYDPPNMLLFKVDMSGVETSFVIHLERLKSAVTQATVNVELVANTFPARLLLRSAKFGKPALNRRFSHRINWLAKIVEARVAAAKA